MTSTALAATSPAAPALSQREMDRLGAEAKLLARSTLIPANLRNKPDQIVSIALWGHAIGLPSMTASCQAIVMINETPFVRPVGLGGLLSTRGYLWSTEVSTPERCVIVGRCPNDPPGWPLRRAEYTMEDAKRAGLPNRNKTYQSHPTEMIFHRALGRWVKMNAPEVHYGLTAAGVGVVTDEGDVELEPFTAEDQAAADATVTEGEIVDDWPRRWSAACKQAGADKTASCALLAYATSRAVASSAEVTDPAERDAATRALDLLRSGELVVVDGRIVEREAE